MLFSVLVLHKHKNGIQYREQIHPWLRIMTAKSNLRVQTQSTSELQPLEAMTKGKIWSPFIYLMSFWGHLGGYCEKQDAGLDGTLIYPNSAYILCYFQFPCNLI